MKREQIYALVVCFVFLYAASYYFSGVLPVPMFWYFPLDRHWEWTLQPSAGLKMGWYGKVLCSWGVGLVGTALLALYLRWRQRSLSASVQGLWDLLAMTSVVFALYYLAHSLALRVL